MKRTTLLLLITSLCSITKAQTYITNVSIADVENKKLIPGQTIVIDSNKITMVGVSKKITPKPGATIIDGTGKYIIPGLVDSHVHFFQSGGLYTRPDGIDLRKYYPYEKDIEWNKQNMEDQLRRYTKAGITTVIDVGSTVNMLNQRDSFANKSYAPRIFMTGPLITSWEPGVFKKLKDDEPFFLTGNEEEARQNVRKQLSAKPDFIKIWYIVQDKNKREGAKKYFPIAKAAIEEANKNGLRVAVHATELPTAIAAVEAGCNYLVHSVDDTLVSDAFIQLLKKNKVVLCPTLVVFHGYEKTFAQYYDFSREDYSMGNPVQLGSLFDLRHLADTTQAAQYRRVMRNNKARYMHNDSTMMSNLKRLTDAGVTIATGTDAGNIGTLHASSYFDELRKMQAAGLNNWQILQASTINGAKAVGKEKEFGSISAGKTADMLLLDANPLDSLSNWEKINIVINKGNIIQPLSLIKETPLALVQRQLNAYNGHDLDAFLEPYAEDVELYSFPDKLLMKGKEQMRKDYAFITKVPGLHCEILNRTIQGNVIVDQEKVSGFGPKPLTALAIYHIENNKIKKVYFIQ